MTEQEAKEILKDLLRITICLHRKQPQEIITMSHEQVEALVIALKALEKKKYTVEQVDNIVDFVEKCGGIKNIRKIVADGTQGMRRG